MARIRSIHPGIFTDEAFVELSDRARWFLMGIWTECDDHGAFEWKPKALKMKLAAADEAGIEPLLEELVLHRFLKRYEIDGRQLGAVRNFCVYQRPKKPNPKHALTAEIRTWVGLERSNGEAVGNQFGTGGEISPQMEDGGGIGGEGEEDNLTSSSRAECREPERAAQPQDQAEPVSTTTQIDDPKAWRNRTSELKARLLEASGPNVDATSLGLEDLRPILDLLASGCDLDTHVLPVLRTSVPNLRKPLRTWAGRWLRDEILAEKAKLSAGIAPAAPAEPRVDFGGGYSMPESTLRKQLERWRQNGSWLPGFGDPPDHPNTKVPATFRKEFGIQTRTLTEAERRFYAQYDEHAA